MAKIVRFGKVGNMIWYVHNATTKRGIIGRNAAEARGRFPRPEGVSQGPKVCVEPITTNEVWCYDIISPQSQRERERDREGKERERERDLRKAAIDAAVFICMRERKREREKV
jgi:hypothetical protein